MDILEGPEALRMRRKGGLLHTQLALADYRAAFTGLAQYRRLFCASRQYAEAFQVWERADLGKAAGAE